MDWTEECQSPSRVARHSVRTSSVFDGGTVCHSAVKRLLLVGLILWNFPAAITVVAAGGGVAVNVVGGVGGVCDHNLELREVERLVGENRARVSLYHAVLIHLLPHDIDGGGDG